MFCCNTCSKRWNTRSQIPLFQRVAFCGETRPARSLPHPTHPLVGAAVLGERCVIGRELEKRRSAAHIGGMAQKSRTKLLEVAIVGRSTSSWEWRVHFGTEVLIEGVESTHTGARLAGYDALFQILPSAQGWDE
jgi:hypothetical protein